MLTHIRVKNFKSWKDSGEVKLAPLTVFFGTNSSGKSSLLQMLLLLKQTIETDEILFFGDENSLVNLGSFKEMIHRHASYETLELEFGYKIKEPFNIQLTVEGRKGSRKLSTAYNYNLDSFTFNTAVFWEQSGPALESCCYRLKSGEQEQIVEVDNTFNKIYGGPSKNEARYSPIIRLSEEFEEIFSSVYYLGPTRIHPQRYYRWYDKDPRDVGLWGDKVIDALLCAHMRRVKILKQGEETTIEDQVSEWLRELDLAYSFSLKPVGALKDDNYEVRIQKSAASPAVTLADIGYGLSDLLPMLVLCYYTPEGSTLILEQPGIHLHPKVQSQLADLLIEVSTERNLQLLIESHSEHLLTRLQRRIAEKKIAADQTALHFCQNDNGVSTIEHLKMDTFGNIENWPPNFFGDEMGDLFAMTEAQRERQKKETELIEGITIRPSK